MHEVRNSRPGDFATLAHIFWRGVHEGAAPRYSLDQRRAWLPEEPTPDVFATRLAGQTVLVAENNGQQTGFMSLRPDGYLDFAYVLPEVRGTGTADALLAVLQNRALTIGLTRLTTRASDMARPFFARHGWHIAGPAPQTREGITIPASDMTRDLQPADENSLQAAS